MSTITVSEKIPVDAPPDRVWRYLVRPSLVVSCLPGAALDGSSEDGRHHTGSVTVKLGAFSVSFRGSADFVEVDDTARRLRVEAKGRDKTGTGTVSMSMEAVVADVGGHSEVRTEASIQLAGKIVSFGRGMIEAVVNEVLASFADCLSSKLAASDGGEDVDGGAGDGTATAGSLPAPPAPGGLGLLVRAFRSWLAGLFRRR